MVSPEAFRLGALVIPEPEERWQSLTATEKTILAVLMGMIRPKVVVELGVHEAVTTRFLCHVLDANQIDCRVFGFDLPEAVGKLRSSQADVREMEASGRLALIAGALPASLVAWLSELEGSVDLALIDALHEYPSVIGELRLLWSRLSPDGYIVLDDYLERTDGVRWAVDTFQRQTPEAMCVPFLSSRLAEGSGVKSKLVVLRRRPYTYSMAENSRRNEWPRTKSRLLQNPVVAKVWSTVRPLFRRGSAGSL